MTSTRVRQTRRQRRMRRRCRCSGGCRRRSHAKMSGVGTTSAGTASQITGGMRRMKIACRSAGSSGLCRSASTGRASRPSTPATGPRRACGARDRIAAACTRRPARPDRATIELFDQPRKARRRLPAVVALGESLGRASLEVTRAFSLKHRYARVELAIEVLRELVGAGRQAGVQRARAPRR